MSAADTLRQAADLIEQRAGKARPGPWTSDRAGSGGNRYSIRGPALGSGVSSRVASIDEPMPSGTARWVALMSPQVAGPLAAWLRVEAEMAENPLCALVEGLNAPIAAWVPATAQPFALALARVILGEASPVPASTDGLDEKTDAVAEQGVPS